MTTASSNNSTSAQDFPSRGLLVLSEIQMVELILALMVFLAIHSLRQEKRQGLACWPVVGMLPSLVLGVRKDLYEWISGVLCRMNGTFTFRGPWFTNLNCVVTCDPRNLEYLLKEKFSNFPKGGYFRNTVQDLLGNGIFSADGGSWHSQRKTAGIEFHSLKFRSLTTDSLLELVHHRLLPVLEESISQSADPLDLQDILLRFTFDNICMIAFGVDPGCLQPGLPDIPFAQAFEAATEATIMRFVIPTFIWKAMRYLGLGTEGDLKLSLKKVDQFADEVIRTRKKGLSLASPEGIKQRSDLLTVFMGLKDEHGRPFSDKFLRDICVNFILAGRDTSSVALSWFFWLLNQKPEVEGRILAEICQILNARDNRPNTECEETLIFKPEEIKKMDYLQAALSEALRLYPSERWLRDGRFTSESAYKFAAFNGGPRLCLGKDFAYYQMKFAAASILYRYQVKVIENHPVVPRMSLTLYMKYGLKVTLSRRVKSELRQYPGGFCSQRNMQNRMPCSLRLHHAVLLRKWLWHPWRRKP